MTEKRFKIVDEQFISYYGGTGHKISKKECGFWLWHNKNESQKVCDKLNSILDENEQLKSTINILTHDNTKMKKVLNTTKKENEHIKNTIQEAYHNERTKLGQSVLKQLMEAIQ